MRPRGVVDERGDEVLVLVSLAALARGSRIRVKKTMFHSWNMRGGRIARWRLCATGRGPRVGGGGGPEPSPPSLLRDPADGRLVGRWIRRALG